MEKRTKLFVFSFIGACVAATLFVVAVPNLIQYLGAYRNGPLSGLVTMHFVHGGFLHLVLNSVFIVIMSTFLSRLLNTKEIVKLFLVSALSASTLVWFFGDPNLPTVGASGIAFGLMGYGCVALTVLYRSFKHDLNTLLVVNLVLTFLIPNISISGHMGGLLAGIGIALTAVLNVYARLSPSPMSARKLSILMLR